MDDVIRLGHRQTAADHVRVGDGAGGKAASGGENSVFAVIRAEAKEPDHFPVAAGKHPAPVQQLLTHILPHRSGLKDAARLALQKVEIVLEPVRSFALSEQPVVYDDGFPVTENMDGILTHSSYLYGKINV